MQGLDLLFRRESFRHIRGRRRRCRWESSTRTSDAKKRRATENERPQSLRIARQRLILLSPKPTRRKRAFAHQILRRRKIFFLSRPSRAALLRRRCSAGGRVGRSVRWSALEMLSLSTCSDDVPRSHDRIGDEGGEFLVRLEGDVVRLCRHRDVGACAKLARPIK